MRGFGKILLLVTGLALWAGGCVVEQQTPGADVHPVDGTITDVSADQEVAPDGVDPCLNVQCVRECETDMDCGVDRTCVISDECCSVCTGVNRCLSDDDCPPCSSCDRSEGICRVVTCLEDCRTDADCGPNRRCVSNEGACCNFCEDQGCTDDSDCGECASCDPATRTCIALPCAGDCLTDADCGQNGWCDLSGGACCGWCVQQPCNSDDDCPSCQGCDGQTGLCVTFPCHAECFIDDDCGPDMRCEQGPDVCCPQCVPSDPCAEVNCVAMCASDLDCSGEDLCIFSADGCCSSCQPMCPGCQSFAGQYCAPPDSGSSCRGGTIEVNAEQGSPCEYALTFVGDSAVDTILLEGCGDQFANLPESQCGLEYQADTQTFLVACDWCGQVPFTKENCGCIPNCDGRECGDDGCGGSCGFCEAGCTCDFGRCMGCGGQYVPLEPDCVHVPPQVVAGGKLPIAVFGTSFGCMQYAYADTVQDGNTITVTVYGYEDQSGECPSCIWNYVGLTYADVLAPGSYVVRVGNGFATTIGASGGLITEPECFASCPQPDIGQWTWQLSHISSQEIRGGCSDYVNIGSELQFAGGCQNFTLLNDDWPWSKQVLQCSDNELYFGTEAIYPATASRCWLPTDLERQVILGVAQGGDQADWSVFLMEGIGTTCSDSDGDGVCDSFDNCPFLPNPDVGDVDQDGLGDACDDDIDGDGVPNDQDCDPYDWTMYPGADERCDGIDNNCNDQIDEGFPDFDGDGIPDCLQQGDMDADGIFDDSDNCPYVANADQLDSDGDDIGDACDDVCGNPEAFAGCTYDLPESECLAQGGFWTTIGLNPEPACQCYTGDGGCPCTSGDECVSACVAEMSEMWNCEDVTRGTCSPYKSTVGCWCMFMEPGAPAQGLCID